MSDVFKGCRINERRRPEGGVSRRERGARWGILLACQENLPRYQRRWFAKFTSKMLSSYFQLWLRFQPVIELSLLSNPAREQSSREHRHQEFHCKILLEAVNRELMLFEAGFFWIMCHAWPPL